MNLPSRRFLHRLAAGFSAGVIFSVAAMTATPAQAQTLGSGYDDGTTPVLGFDNGNWTATDDLGRKLPTLAEAGPPHPNRWVGVFYTQWHNGLRCLPDYDITEFLKTHPRFMDWTAFPPGGPAHPTWYWAQPLLGYYRSDDAWVIRKHLILLADAGVDFLYLDDTNDSIHEPELGLLLDVAQKLQAEGVHVPRFVFFLNFQYAPKVEQLYTKWFLPGKYDSLWFKWHGKPLLLCPLLNEASPLKDKTLLPALQDYFTWRPTWALFDAAQDPTKWRFMCTIPVAPAKGPDGQVEETVVSKSMGGPIWNNMEVGGVSCLPGHVPVYNDQFLSADNARGLFFQEEWDEAEKANAPILLMTGWNEWTASVWETPGVVMLGRTTGKGQGHIVDEFNQDFNRDIEPMKGGYRDNYYMQFVNNMRRYKGVAAPPVPSAPKTMPMNGDFSAWRDVQPIYHHAAAVAGTAARDWNGNPPGVHYTDMSNRNEPVLAQVARDNRTVYFHVQTAEALTPSTDSNWMMLYLDADNNAATGWNGYDLVIDRGRHPVGPPGVEAAEIEANVGNRWEWKKIGTAVLHWQGRDLEVAVPRAMLGGSDRLSFNFKWADNLPDAPDLMDFYTTGSAAPDGRFMYHFEELP